MDMGAESYLRFLDGDNNGLAEIIRDYKDGLILYLRSFAEDIYQAEEFAEDTFVKLVTNRPRFGNRSTFKTWLYAIGRNVALDQARKRSRHREVSIDECPEIAEEISLERSYLLEEQKIRLHGAMKKLKAEYRQILWLIYFEDFTNREAAVVMKRSTHSVETLVYRARLALKKQLEKEGFHYEKL